MDEPLRKSTWLQNNCLQLCGFCLFHKWSEITEERKPLPSKSKAGYFPGGNKIEPFSKAGGCRMDISCGSPFVFATVFPL